WLCFQFRNMRLLSAALRNSVWTRGGGTTRHFWGWINAVFNRVDYERIKAIGPDRAAAEWLLRCGAKVRFLGFERWHHDYNALPTGPLDRYKIQGIDATESCIMYRGFDHLDGLQHLEEVKLIRCVYIEDGCLERLSSTEVLQSTLSSLEVVSCGNVSDKGLIALHKLGNLQRLVLSDLPGVKDRDQTLERLKTALPKLDITVDL
uniref:Distal membrane arm assembly component 2 like n=1 Tax=Gadus morhua TaxID=8049 RepID=A0A8C5A2J0_GADMO